MSNKPIADSKKREPNTVKTMFARIAPAYDFINKMMTFGLDVIWRKKLVRELNIAKNNAKIADIACGSGDVAIEIIKNYPNAKVDCIDFCSPMLDIAKQKFAKKALLQNADFFEADCQNLPFNNNNFDGATISFGFRNFQNRQDCLIEISRVLKQNSKLCILEVSKAEGLFARAQYLFMGKFVPFIASICGAKKEDYIYLAKTTLEYPAKSEIEKMFQNADFKDVKTINLAFGLVAITTGTKA